MLVRLCLRLCAPWQHVLLTGRPTWCEKDIERPLSDRPVCQGNMILPILVPFVALIWLAINVQNTIQEVHETHVYSVCTTPCHSVTVS